MNADDAEQALHEVELVACAQAPLLEAKQLRDACLEAEIPVLLERGACCGARGCGCAPKLELCARAEDVPRVASLLRDRWQALALREGIVNPDHPSVARPTTDETSCPACGSTAPLAGGACSDCGLQLE
jgi:hypothetical protein